MPMPIPGPGRPSDYTPEMDDKICELIASGKSLSEICAVDGMPHRDTVYTWMGANKAFADRYRSSFEARGELLGLEIVQISDEAAIDPTTEKTQAAKLRCDARKWVASKLYPHKFGDKVSADVKVTGQIIIQSTPTDESA